MKKLSWIVDNLFHWVLLGIIFCWLIWPEDIVGTRELALVLFAVLMHDVRCKQ